MDHVIVQVHPSQMNIKVRKNGQQKACNLFAKLLQNELNSDVAGFTTHVQTCLLQIRLLTGLMWVVKR